MRVGMTRVDDVRTVFPFNEPIDVRTKDCFGIHCIATGNRTVWK